ncbi:hypothetical protein GH714_026996 [Hevea brasiliensis]|uniref:RNase H type-1 domain-containing protein n=1 Tax=Hevea brasiliensis TaxID=3981 RepID=A0A6A6MHH4_HEVBR|nr:hypothetical protein GH714_026996 [Hevea brasiliensis]
MELERNSTSANSSGSSYDSMWKYLWNLCLPPKTFSAPATDALKMNLDAAIIEGVCCGLGMVLRNHKGEILMSAAFRLDHSLPPEDAEVEAACLGIQRARDAGFRVFTLEFDSFLLVHHVQKRLVLPSYLGTRIQSLLMEMDDCSFVDCLHVFREANLVAHALAKFALNLDVDEPILMEEFPPSISGLVALDALSI